MTRVETSRGAVIDNSNLGRFELVVGGDLVSYADYRLDIGSDGRGVVTVPHVETRFTERGNGYAAELMDGLLTILRATDRTIRPLCSFAAGHVRSTPDHHDLLAP